MRNLDDVMRQMEDFGLLPELPLDVSGNLVRSKVEGDHEKRGWYVLHVLPGEDGGLVVGSFGIWRGPDNNAQKVALPASANGRLSPEQRKAANERIRSDARRAEAARRAAAERAARRAESAWRKCSSLPPEEGACDYLEKKGIGAHGVRYAAGGALAIAMHDAMGRVHGLQFILDTKRQKSHIKRLKRTKTYWPPGVSKVGKFFLIGSPSSLVLLAEGYATAATLHEATGHPVAVAFDAGNLVHAAKALGWQEECGTLEKGKAADFALWDISHPAELSYYIGFSPCEATIRGGQNVHPQNG